MTAICARKPTCYGPTASPAPVRISRQLLQGGKWRPITPSGGARRAELEPFLSHGV